ncbi:MAG: transporter [Deltaproteobacteria bacterium]|nr:transporter [Deltaproteobacteria bacterium]
MADNSFLLEEAYNQDAGVVQQIGAFSHDVSSRGWVASFTQEWPAPEQRHQLSYSLAYSRGAAGSPSGLGDILLNYRYQAVLMDVWAVAPRLSAVFPGGAKVGYRGFGLQVMLPVSVQLTQALAAHTNLGGAWVPDGLSGPYHGQWRSLALGQSLVWLVIPRLNFLGEFLWTSTSRLERGSTSSTHSLLLSPGVRWGIDLPERKQVVVGLALPLGLGPSAGDVSILLYLSLEMPFWDPEAGPNKTSAAP